jgi:phosphatidate cytidylyltransferase
MSKAPSNLAVRLATAAVAVPLILALLYYGPHWGFYLVVLGAGLICTAELFAMTHPGDSVSRGVGIALSGLCSLVLYLFGHDLRAVITLLALTPLVGPAVTLVRLGDIPTAAFRAVAMSVGPLFAAVPLTLIAIVRRDAPGPEGASYVVMTLMFAWFADTGGYFAGRFLGKRKLYEAVSPKKTVAGAFGGLGGSLIGGLLAHFWYLPTVPLAHVVPLALVASVAGQVGDLAESLVKRSTGVKDSGQIVPGHGGMLDRVDALLYAGTVVFLYTIWVR